MMERLAQCLDFCEVTCNKNYKKRKSNQNEALHTVSQAVTGEKFLDHPLSNGAVLLLQVVAPFTWHFLDSPDMKHRHALI